jgi:hypothetical protein
MSANTLNSLSLTYSKSFYNTNKPGGATNFISLANQPAPLTYRASNEILQLSKILNIVNKNLFFTNFSLNTTDATGHIISSNGLLKSTLKYRSSNTFSNKNTLTLSESFYTGMASTTDFRIHNIQLSLNDIHRILKKNKYPNLFLFNLENNLNMAKQQRWFAKNSLLSESIIPNSFLVTQVKKLIGTGLLDNDFTNKTLWLPTKASKLSSVESFKYFSNLSGNIFSKDDFTLNHLQSNNLRQSFFKNINYFENSRLWLFKKYFFTNNQTQNLISENPTHIQANNYAPVNHNHLNLIFNINTYVLNLTPTIYDNLVPSIGVVNTKSNKLG